MKFSVPSGVSWRYLESKWDDIGMIMGFKGMILIFSTGWWFGTSILFSHILGIIIPID